MPAPSLSGQTGSLVATLIAPATQAAIDDYIIGKAAAALGVAASCTVLAEGVAIDLTFEGNDAEVKAGELKAIESRLRLALRDVPVDVAVQGAGQRRKRLFLADMDSTMIGQECIDELADFVGLKEKVSAITESAMRGEIAFEPALRERVALLKGLPLAVIGTIIAERLTLTPGGLELVRTMRANGGYTCLVSGGFTLFTGPISQKIGFHEHRSNRLGTEGDVLSGLVDGAILGRQAKLDTLIELRNAHGLQVHETMAVGDGANDLAMLGEAGLGVAFHAKPKVAEEAHVRIDHGDLTALLYLQGYRREQFVIT